MSLRGGLGRDRKADDAGVSLVELLISMGIFTVVLAVFLAGVTTMLRNTAQAEAVSDSTTAARRVLDRFDVQVRSASAINMPGTGVSGYYIEYLGPPAVAGGVKLCHQWRYQPSTDEIATRTWASNTVPGALAWSVVAGNVRNAPTDLPFVYTRAGTKSLHQQLTVVLDVGHGTRPGARVSSTYVARNTSTATLSNNDSPPNGLSDTPVCSSVAARL